MIIIDHNKSFLPDCQYDNANDDLNNVQADSYYDYANDAL